MLSLLAACAIAASPQDASLLKQTFASGPEGWTVIQIAGGGADVSAAHDPAHIREGVGSLHVEYEVNEGQTSAAYLPVVDSFARMKSIRFWIMADHNAPIAVLVQEKGGGRYSGAFFAPKNQWQAVELGLNDFVLSTDADSPQDANGKLDTDKIESLTFIDFDQFIAQNKPIAELLGVQKGKRNFWVSDFQVTPTGLPDTATVVAGEATLDTFGRPQVAWNGMAVEGLAVVGGSPFPKALRLDFQVRKQRVAGVIRAFRSGLLANCTTATFRLASAKPCSVILQLEEVGGGKYNATVDVPGDSKPVEKTLLLSGLVPADDSKDANGKLDPDRIEKVTILSVDGFLGSAEQPNTLWIGGITAKK